MKDTRNLLLVLLSVGLVATWAYLLYDKAQNARPVSLPCPTDSLDIAHLRDSMTRQYTDSLSGLDASLDSTRLHVDSLQSSLALKLQEIGRLRSEILRILGKKNLSEAEKSTAVGKMALLQEKMGELREENQNMEEEKRQFGLTLQQLTRNVDSMQQYIQRLSSENKVLTEKNDVASLFTATDIKLAAVNVRSATREQETAQVKRADKFVISFTIQNTLNSYENAEIAVIIVQPDNHVLQNTKWDSGVFDSKSDGRKTYTRIVKFDYVRGEQKKLEFSLDADEFQKGNYLLQLWHRSVLIGQSVTGLN